MTIADDPYDFVEKVVKLLLDANEIYRQEQQALAYSKARHSQHEVSQEFANCYDEISSRKNKKAEISYATVLGDHSRKNQWIFHFTNILVVTGTELIENGLFHIIVLKKD